LRHIVAAGPGNAYLYAMATHRHYAPQDADLALAAQATLERSGEQWTVMRANIFRALAGFDKPASAYDIAEAVSKSEGRRVAANSVYRILDLFVTANLARRTRIPIACTIASSWCATGAGRSSIWMTTV
jgi:hypothetical protein